MVKRRIKITSNLQFTGIVKLDQDKMVRVLLIGICFLDAARFMLCEDAGEFTGAACECP